MSSSSSGLLAIRGYIRGRVSEMASPATRATTEPLAGWAQKRIRLEGKPFRFDGHEYLRTIYNDTAQHVVLSKAAQIGGTTWAILRAIHSCVMGLSGMYFFPTRTDVLEFSRSRVGPLLQQNPFLGRLITDTDTVGLKRIGTAYLYLRGMQSTVGMKSVPADWLVFDELDEASPEAKSLARERLAHSDYKRIVELSNPSLPDYGIDAAYAQSDQRDWFVRCAGCGQWSSPVQEFPTRLGHEVRIIQEREDGTAFLACPKCAEPLGLDDGEWVPAFPDRSIHGYRISQLMSSKVDPAEILREYRTTRFPERFYNLKVGIAWADTQNRLDRAAVLACCGEAGLLEGSDRSCTMGVDTGSLLHVVVSRRIQDSPDRREVIYIGTRQEYSELDELMKRYKVSRCVIDALPEIHATRAFAKRHLHRIFLNYFQESQRGAFRWDTEEHLVYENRTEALDTSRQAIRERRVVLPRGGPVLQEFADHLAADVKQLVEDEETGARAFRYVKTGTNHYSLAFTYDCIAATRDYGCRSASGRLNIRFPWEWGGSNHRPTSW